MWPEVWTKIGKAVQKREKQEWAIEKPKDVNGGRLRGIYFIDPEDGAYEETIKNGRKVGRFSGGGDALQKGNQEALPVSGN